MQLVALCAWLHYVCGGVLNFWVATGNVWVWLHYAAVQLAVYIVYSHENTLLVLL